MRFRSLLHFVLPPFLLSFAATAHAQEAARPAGELSPPTPPPAADLPPPSARTTHLIAGIATTAVSYGLALGASFLVEERDYRGAKQLRIPLAGPWMALAKTRCPVSDPECGKAGLIAGALVVAFDGVIQAGGLAILGEGLFLKTSSGRPVARKAEGPSVRAVPMNFERGGLGLGVVGRF